MKKETIIRFIENRRAIYPKMFSGGKIPDKQIHQLLESAHWAPSHKRTEPWRFVVFTGKGLQKLARFQADLYKARCEREGDFSEEKYQKLLSKPLLCSHIIAIGAKRTEIVPHQEDICATSCAVQNLWLTASAVGLGCYWSTGGITYYEDAKAFFGLTDNDTLLGFINLGVMNKPWPVGKRDNLQEKVTWIDR